MPRNCRNRLARRVATGIRGSGLGRHRTRGSWRKMEHNRASWPGFLGRAQLPYLLGEARSVMTDQTRPDTRCGGALGFLDKGGLGRQAKRANTTRKQSKHTSTRGMGRPRRPPGGLRIPTICRRRVSLCACVWELGCDISQISLSPPRWNWESVSTPGGLSATLATLAGCGGG